MALTSLNPSPLRIATTNNYIGSSDFINNTDGIIDADRGEMLVERYGKQNLTGLLEMLGNKAPVDSTTFYHYEEDWIHTIVTGTLNGTNTELTISAPVETFDASTNDISSVRVGDILRNAAGGVVHVTAVTPAAQSNKATVVAVVATGLSTAENTKFAIVGNAFDEGTDQPRGLTPGLHEYSNNVQIMKESYEVSGSALTEKIWFEVNDPATGRTGYVWALKGEGDTFRRFNNYCETQMIVGRRQTPSVGTPMTEGLEAFAQSGNIATVDNLDSTNNVIAHFVHLATTLDANRGAKENLYIMGFNRAILIDSFLSADSRLTQGGVSYGAFNGSQEVAAGFGIDSMYLGGYTFHKMRYEPFSYPQLLGGIGYTDKGCVIPMDSQVDASSRASIPSLRIRYKAAEGYSREMEHWMEGGAGLDVKTNGLDVLKLNYRTERGFEGFAANRFIWVD